MTRFCSHCSLLAFLLAAAGPVLADEPPDLGKDHRNWMELQKAQKPGANERISGEQADVIWKRYVNSFGREIPDQLRDDSAVSSGGR